MRFFDRTEEIASLRKIREMAKNNAQFTVVTGRRRIGKTSLVWKAYEDEPILYFFVADVYKRQLPYAFLKLAIRKSLRIIAFCLLVRLAMMFIFSSSVRWQ